MSRVTQGALIAGGALLIWLALDLLLLVFAGVLLAIFLRTLSAWLAGATRLPMGVALAVVVLAILGSAVLAGVLYAPRLAEQGDQLTETLPRAVSDLTSRIREYSWGEWMLDRFAARASDTDVAGRAQTALSRLMDGAVSVIVILFTGLYLAAEPRPYVRGLLHLVPPRHRRRAAETLYATGHVLRWWLFGQALAMALVGLAMGFGLGFIGVQFAFALGVLAGLFEFIPLIGPVIALGPALLIALANDFQQAMYVLVLYTIVQTGESYLLTPLVQRKAVELPPVVTITTQVGLAWAAGPIGLLVAVPLTAVAMVAMQMLYVGDRLGDEVAPEFERQAQEDVEAQRGETLRGLVG